MSRMKFKVKLLLVFVIVMLSVTKSNYLFSQVADSIPIDQQTEQLIENISEANDGAEIDYSEISEELNYYLENPININNANADVLTRVLLLTDFQVYKLKAYISTTGELVSLYELNNVEGFDLQTIYRILPYVKVAATISEYYISLKDVMKFGRQQFFMRYIQVIEPAVGYSSITDSALAAKPNSRYIGTPQKLYTKYSFNYKNKIRFGITGEKDAGEEFFTGTQKKALISIQHICFLKILVLLKHWQ